jgi:hypothetical protein
MPCAVVARGGDVGGGDGDVAVRRARGADSVALIAAGLDEAGAGDADIAVIARGEDALLYSPEVVTSAAVTVTLP